MKLPPAPPASLAFQNAPGSTVPQEFALAARANPDVIKEMAETPSETRELQKEALARQYVLIIDRSGSMGSRDGMGTRWDSAASAVAKIIETVFRYDVDHSVPLYLFDHETTFIDKCTSVGQVTQVFAEHKPRGTTDLAKALDVAMEEYLGRKRPNYATVPGTTFIVLLDGGADDEIAVRSVIQKFANPVNGYITNHTQAAVSFVQIGDDAGATRFLKDLDDNLPPIDVVDTAKDDVIYTPGGIDRLLHDAIFD